MIVLKKSLCLKNFILIFTFVLIFVYFSSSTFAQNDLGCCYFANLTDGTGLYYTEPQCDALSPDSTYFDDTDPLCQDAKLACLCDDNFLDDSRIISYYGNAIDFFGDWGYSSNKFNIDITKSIPYSDAECFAFCKGTDLAEYKFCEQENTVGDLCYHSQVTSDKRWCAITANDERGLTFADQDSCLNALGVAPGEYTISGNVKDNSGNTLENVIIVLTGEVQRSTNTDEDGNFNLLDLPQGIYTLRASKSGYTENSTSFSLSSNIQRNFVISEVVIAETDCAIVSDDYCSDLTQYDDACCNPECGFVSQWVAFDDFIGINGVWTRTTCTDVLDNNCDGFDDLSSIIACSAYLEIQEECGDGFITGGEECDGDYYCDPDGCFLIGTECGDGIYNPVTEQCDYSDSLHDPNSDLCDSSCELEEEVASTMCFSTSDCVNKIPGFVGECEDGICIWSSEDVIDTQTCLEQGGTDPVLYLSHNILNTIVVSYEHSCPANSYTFWKYRMEDGDSCDEDDYRFELVTNLIDSDILPESEYCYKIKAVYDFPIGVKIDTETIETGDAVCFNTESTEDEMCDDNQVITCNNNNFAELVEDCTEKDAICINNHNDARCVYQSQCDYCNVIYGVSPYDSFTWYKESGQLNLDKTNCKNVDSCYQDYFQSSVNKWINCSVVTSCYDYQSRGACDDNPCRDDVLVSDCEWHSDPALGDLGFGVCMPQDDTKQDCSRCEDGEGLLSCSRSRCELYGQCYYADRSYLFGNPAGSNYLCEPKDQVGCGDFETLEDCIDSDSLHSKPGYSGEPKEIELIESPDTNLIEQASDDYFAFEKCRWNYDQERCEKDANDNNINDCSDDDNYEGNTFECWIDNTDPFTGVDCPDVVGNLINLDIELDEPVLATYYGFAKQNTEYVKPNWQAHENKITINTQDEESELGSGFFDDDGLYEMYYYSVDVHNNPEVVKSCTFFVDHEEPTIDVDMDFVAKPDYEDNEFVSDVTISLDITDNYLDDNYVLCSSRLLKYDKGVTKTFSQQLFDVTDELRYFGVPDTYSKQLNDLEDGSYALILNCTDKAGNRNYQSVVFVAHADDRIYDIYPSEDRFNEDVNQITFKVKNTNSQCGIRKVQDSTNLESLEYEDMDGSLSCVKNVDQYTCNVNAEEDGVYAYLIRCRYTDANNNPVETNSDSHIARFALDKTPPELYYKIFQGNEDVTDVILNNPNYVLTETTDFQVECNDPELSAWSSLWNFGREHCYMRYSVDYGSFGSLKKDKFTIHNIGKDTVYTVMANDTRNAYQTEVSLSFDFTKANLDLQVLNSEGVVVDTLVPGHYTLSAASTKPLKNILASALVLGEDDAIELRCPATLDPYDSVFECSFTIGNERELYQDAEFEFTVNDFHDISSTKIRTGSTVFIDSTKPSEIIFAPELEPLHNYYDVITKTIFDVNDELSTSNDSLDIYGTSIDLVSSIDYYDLNAKNVELMEVFLSINLLDDYFADIDPLFRSILNFIPGSNEYTYTVHKGNLLHSNGRTIELNNDPYEPTIFTNINQLYTNTPVLGLGGLEYYYRLCEDREFDSGLDSSSLIISITDAAWNMPSFVIDNDCTINYFEQELANGWNSVGVSVEDKVSNQALKQYPIYYDPNILMINSFNIFDASGKVSNKVDDVLYQGYTYNDINAISTSGSHNYSVVFSDEFTVNSVLLNDNNVTDYNVDGNEISFVSEDSSLIEDMNILTITATKSGTDLEFSYNLNFIYDTVDPEIQLDTPGLTKGMNFETTIIIPNEQFDIENLNITTICKETATNQMKYFETRILPESIFGTNNEYNAIFNLPETDFYDSCMFTIFAEDKAGNLNSITESRPVDAYAPSLEIISVAKSSICAEDLTIVSQDSNTYLSQCSMVDITVKVSDDAEYVKYDLTYPDNPNSNLIDYVVDDLTTYDDDHKQFFISVPLHIAQGLLQYTTITDTLLEIYVRDNNPLNNNVENLVLRYRDKDYSQPPTIDIKFTDMDYNEVQALTYGTYIVLVSSDSEIRNNAVNFTYKYYNDNNQFRTRLDVLDIGASPLYTYSYVLGPYVISEEEFPELIDKTAVVNLDVFAVDKLGLSTKVTRTFDFDSIKPVLSFEPTLGNAYYSDIFEKYNDDIYTQQDDVVLGLNSSKQSFIQYNLQSKLNSFLQNQEVYDFDIDVHEPTETIMKIKSFPSFSENHVDVTSYYNPLNYDKLGFADGNGDVIRGVSDTYPNYGILNDINDATLMTYYILDVASNYHRLNLSQDVSKFKSSAEKVRIFDNSSNYVDKFNNIGLGLKLGTNDLELLGKDYANNYADIKRLGVVYDNQFPAIIDYGVTGCRPSSQEHTIYAKVLDFEDLAGYAELKLYVDEISLGSTYSYDDEDGYRYYYVYANSTFTETEHTAKLSAEDRAGNIYNFEWTFNIADVCSFDTELNVDNAVEYYNDYILNNNALSFDFDLVNTDEIEGYRISDVNITLQDTDSLVLEPIDSFTTTTQGISGTHALPMASAYKVKIKFLLQNIDDEDDYLYMNGDKFAYEYLVVYDNEQPLFTATVPLSTYSDAVINVIANLLPDSGLNYDESKRYDDYNIYTSTFCLEDDCVDMYAHDNLHHAITYTVPQLEDGNYAYTITMTDLAGNQNSINGNLNIDNTVPTMNYVVEVPSGNVISYDNYTLTNSNEATLKGTLSSNTYKIYYARSVGQIQSYYEIDIYNPSTTKMFEKDLILNDLDNIFRFKLIGNNGRIVYQDVNISVDKQAPILSEENIVFE